MEAVLSKLQCRAVHSLVGEDPERSFDQMFIGALTTNDKPDVNSLSTEPDRTASTSNEDLGNFSIGALADLKGIADNIVVSSDDFEGSTSQKVTAAGFVQDDSTTFNGEPVVEEQDSKPVETRQILTCDPTSDQPVAGKNRLSRRKPQKTRRVLVSEKADDTVLPHFLDDDLRDYMLVAPGSAESQSSYLCYGSTFESPETGSKVNSENPDAGEGIIELPEGTVLVHPESADASPQYLEMESSRAKKIFKGNLGSAIIHCTACNKQIGLDGFLDIHRHPVLKVLICKKCFILYNDLEIEQDAEGSDEQCRWCGQGGDLICCDFCHNALCKGCIRRNLGRKELGAILSADEGVKWKCYVCDPKPLLNLIEHCTSIMEALTKQEKRQQEQENRRKRTDARSKTASSSVASSSESSAPDRSVSVIRAPSVSVMGRSLLKQVAVRAEPRQQPQSYAVDGNRASPDPPGAAHSARNGTIFVATAPGAGSSRGLPGSGAKISLVPVDDRGLLQMLDRLLSATNSMGMFLASLKADLRRTCGTSTVFDATQMQRRREIASKLWRAYSSYNKSLKDGTSQTNETVRKTNSAAKVILRPGSSSSQSKAEVIELSDSDENTDNASRKVIQHLGSRLQGVFVGAESEIDVAEDSVGTEVWPSSDLQPSVTVVSTPTDKTQQSDYVAGNRRKRKHPRQFLDADETPKRMSLVDGDPEDSGDDRTQQPRSEENDELRRDGRKLEAVTECRDGVLRVEIGDDLEEVIRKIANGVCSSIELSTEQTENPAIKKCGIVGKKLGEDRARCQANGHVSPDSISQSR